MISNNLKKRIYTSLILLSLLILIFNFNFILLYSLLIFSVLSIIEFLQLSNKIFTKKVYYYALNLFFIIYVSIFSILFVLLSNSIGSKIILYTILIGCISSDIGGFTLGKIFGGPKLTKISPKKTYSGAIGSILFTIICVSLLFFYLLGTFNYELIIISIVISISCQIGDLLFSFIKRKAKLKDTGNFLPGHGGILDRLDGIFLGIPFGFLTLILLN